MRTKIALLAVVLGLIAVQAPSMAFYMDENGVGHSRGPADYAREIDLGNGLKMWYDGRGTYDCRGPVAPVVETPVAPATAAVQTAARVSVNPAEVLPMNANNLQNLEPGMNFVDMQCIKIAPSALLPKAY